MYPEVTSIASKCKYYIAQSLEMDGQLRSWYRSWETAETRSTTRIERIQLCPLADYHDKQKHGKIKIEQAIQGNYIAVAGLQKVKAPCGISNFSLTLITLGSKHKTETKV